MQTRQFLHRILMTSASLLHSARFNALATCVEALLSGQRPSLTAIGRQLPRQAQPKHAIKCVDHLLSNPHLQRKRRWLYADVARLLVGTQRHPIILVDWSPIDDRGHHFLLRAAISFGKRSFPIYERVHHKDACPRCQKALLADLAWMLPSQAKPIFITDAGFKTPWLRAVEAYGWYYVGRVRGATQLSHDGESDWRRLESLFPLATREPAARGPSPWPRHGHWRPICTCTAPPTEGAKTATRTAVRHALPEAARSPRGTENPGCWSVI